MVRMAGFRLCDFLTLAVMLSVIGTDALPSGKTVTRADGHFKLADFLREARDGSEASHLVSSRTADGGVPTLTCYDCALTGPLDNCVFKEKSCAAGMLCGVFVFESGSFNGCVDPGMCSVLQSSAAGVSGRCCSVDRCNLI